MFSAVRKKLSTIFEKRGTPDVYDDFWYSAVPFPTSSGKKVNNHTAMRLWAVYACVSLISETLAGLPLKVKRRRPGGGTEDATDHHLYDVLKLQPNKDMTSFTWREACQGNLLCSGNAYSFIDRNNMGLPRLLVPIEPHLVEPKKEKNKFYYIVDQGGGKKVIVQPNDMLHVVGFGFNGIQGESVITNFAKETVGNALAIDEFQGSFFKNGIHTSGTLEHPETLGDNKESFIEALRNRYQGGKNAGVPMVLESGMKFKQNKVSLVDQQFLEQMEATALQICGIFKVPPSKIGIYGKGTSYNNTEQQGKNFLDTTMLQWLVRWEQAMDVKLLAQSERKEGYFIKYNFDALLRPDAKTRAEIAQIEWQQGVPLNVIRERNDENPVPGGDVGYVPLNFIPTTQAETGFEEKDDERSVCSCGTEHRSVKTEDREKAERSITGRDRVSRAWRPIIRKAAEKVVRREILAVKREAEKHNKQRATSDFVKWMDGFYESLSEIIISEFLPIIRGYQEQMADAIALEVGEEIDQKEINKLSKEYTEGLSKQWVNSSRGQLIVLLEDIKDDYTAIVERADDWDEKRPEKVERQQITSAGGAVAVAVFSAFGLSYVWSVRGKSTCPYCLSMNGKVMKKGGIFADGGSELTPEGEEPFKVRNNVRYPAIHQNCDCYLRVTG